MNENDCCGACKYFVETQSSSAGRGNCRRYAPKPKWHVEQTLDINRMDWSWPEVSHKWWCGEFELHYMIDMKEHYDLG